MGKSTINGKISIAMLNYQRVTWIWVYKIIPTVEANWLASETTGQATIGTFSN